MKVETLSKKILLGEGNYAYDEEELHALNQAVVARLKEVRERANIEGLSKFKKGDRVRLTGIRPKYMNGLAGTVEGKNGTKIAVQIDAEEYTGRYRKDIVVGAASLVKA